MQRHRILVALDDSDAADRAVRYVAAFGEASSPLHVHLLHLLPPIPSELLEHGGAEEPAAESRLDEKLRRRRREWEAEEERRAERLFQGARSILGSGVDTGTETRRTVDEMAVARRCLDSAAEADCATIAIGRESLPWYREFFHRHVADDLVRQAEDVTIWVVA